MEQRAHRITNVWLGNHILLDERCEPVSHQRMCGKLMARTCGIALVWLGVNDCARQVPMIGCWLRPFRCPPCSKCLLHGYTIDGIPVEHGGSDGCLMFKTTRDESARPSTAFTRKATKPHHSDNEEMQVSALNACMLCTRALFRKKPKATLNSETRMACEK